MGRTIAVANQKGGVGKTTTSVNLAAALGAMQQQVLLIDLDPQGNATMGCGIDKHNLEQSVYEVLIERTPVAEVCCRAAENAHDVLPANADLTAAEVELLSVEGRERRLREALAPVVERYDFLLIDCPPSLNVLTLNAFVAADSVLVPIQCEYYALEGLSALLETYEGVREAVNPALQIEGLLRTMYDGRNNLGNEVSEQLVQHFGEQVLRTIVPRNVRLAEAPSHGMSIVGYDRGSRGALAYLALAGEIIRHRARPSAAQLATSQAADEPCMDLSGSGEDVVLADPDPAVTADAESTCSQPADAPGDVSLQTPADGADTRQPAGKESVNG